MDNKYAVDKVDHISYSSLKLFLYLATFLQHFFCQSSSALLHVPTPSLHQSYALMFCSYTHLPPSHTRLSAVRPTLNAYAFSALQNTHFRSLTRITHSHIIHKSTHSYTTRLIHKPTRLQCDNVCTAWLPCTFASTIVIASSCRAKRKVDAEKN